MPPTAPTRPPRRAAPTPELRPIENTGAIAARTGLREKTLAGPEELIPGARFRVGRCWRWRTAIVEQWLRGER